MSDSMEGVAPTGNLMALTLRPRIPPPLPQEDTSEPETIPTTIPSILPPAQGSPLRSSTTESEGLPKIYDVRPPQPGSTGFIYVSLSALIEVVPQTWLPPCLWSCRALYKYHVANSLKPETRSQAIRMYSDEDRKAIRDSGANYPQSPVENPNINLDFPFVRRPNFDNLLGRSPCVLLGQLKCSEYFRIVQRMNDFAVGRPRSEEMWYREFEHSMQCKRRLFAYFTTELCNRLHIAFDYHHRVNSLVETLYPLYYSELYVHNTVHRAKNEVSFSTLSIPIVETN